MCLKALRCHVVYPGDGRVGASTETEGIGVLRLNGVKPMKEKKKEIRKEENG